MMSRGREVLRKKKKKKKNRKEAGGYVDVVLMV
jgi:hypothetical protein